MKITLDAQLRKIKPNETIPAGALHSLDGITFLPIVNPETIGQKAIELSPEVKAKLK